MSEDFPSLSHHVRVGAEDCHYGGGMMSGAHMIELATDCAGELSYVQNGMRSLLAAVKEANFYEGVFAGEALVIEVAITKMGNRSREMEYSIHKTLIRTESGMKVAKEPVLASKGIIVLVNDKPITDKHS